MRKPQIVGATFVVTQEADCCDDMPQQMAIEIADGGGGPYFVLKTDRWAIDDIEELKAILDRALASVDQPDAEQIQAAIK